MATKTMITVRSIDTGEVGTAFIESWDNSPAYIMVSGNFERKGKKVDALILPKNKLIVEKTEEIKEIENYISTEEIDEAKPSVMVQHKNGSKGFVFPEDWNSNKTPLFVRDSETWTLSDDMIECTYTIDNKGTSIKGFYIERMNLVEIPYEF